MAEGGKDFISSIQRELECGICLDEITNAKLLQCLHTFCEKCLKTLNKHGEILCPICRTTTTLSEQGVRGLASHRFVNRITELVQAQRGSSTSGVSFCGNCDAERAIKFYCFDCKHFLCEPCTDTHNKMKLYFKGHQVVQLDNFSSKDCENFVGNQAKCKRHNKEELRFYCEDCDECICRDCTVVEHRNHNCLHIEDAAAKQTEAIRNKVTRVENCFNILDARCKLLDESSSALKKEAEKAKSDIKATCDLLIRNIKKHLEEETNYIEKQTQVHCQVLSSQKETLLAQSSKLRDSLSFNKAVLNRGCFSEIMELKQVLNDRIDELEFSIQRQIEPSIKLLHIQYENNDDNIDFMISQIGKVRFHVHHVADLSIPKAKAEDTERKLGTEEKMNQFARYTKSKEKKKGLQTQQPVEDRKEKCAICLDNIRNPKTLNKCSHTFCKDCIDKRFEERKKTCPVCNQSYNRTVGNQPLGEMTVSEERYCSLPGYERYGRIMIMYNFPDGIQGHNHPNPGHPYRGTSRRAFLPACKEGYEVLQLLRKAFDARLVFTVGRSETTGWDNQIIWNGIHHKTSDYGGPQRYGYPDPNYFSRVREELAAKGIQ